MASRMSSMPCRSNVTTRGACSGMSVDVSYCQLSHVDVGAKVKVPVMLPARSSVKFIPKFASGLVSSPAPVTIRISIWFRSGEVPV